MLSIPLLSGCLTFEDASHVLTKASVAETVDDKIVLQKFKIMYIPPENDNNRRAGINLVIILMNTNNENAQIAIFIHQYAKPSQAKVWNEYARSIHREYQDVAVGTLMAADGSSVKMRSMVGNMLNTRNLSRYPFHIIYTAQECEHYKKGKQEHQTEESQSEQSETLCSQTASQLCSTIVRTLE